MRGAELRGSEINGGVAQLGERLLCKQEVIGSIPFTSTNCLEGSGVRSVDVIRFVRGSVTSLRGSISLDVEVGVGRHAVRVAWWYGLAGEKGVPWTGDAPCTGRRA